MTRVGALFTVRRRFFRSVNLASDALRADACDGYALTPLGRATLGRVLDGLGEGRAERAWTLTGPYGVGKSAFVVLLAQALGAESVADPSAAMRALRAVDPALERRCRGLRESTRGFGVVLVNGTYGPLLPALLDAVEGTLRQMHRHGVRHQALLDDLGTLRGSRARGADLHRRVVALFGDLAELVAQRRGAGLLLVIDELGKCLEFAAQHPGRVDEVFLLQELAEAAARSGNRPFVLITLLHQSFDRYARDLAAERRAEWAKVQGRFEDVAFVEAPAGLLHLAARTIRRDEVLPASRFAAYDALAAEAVALDLVPLDEADTLRRLAPLHPTVALLLPALCRGPLAQNERSLFGFLTSTAEGGLGAFLDTPLYADGGAPTYALDRLHDFLAATLGPARYALATGRRWAAVDEGVARLPSSEPELSARLLKAIGVLSILGSRQVRASRAVLCFALASSAHPASAVAACLDRLVAASHVVYRRHADAFALWEGSDVDLDAHFEAARRRLLGIDEVTSLLRDRSVLRPWVARRHFFETGTLRYFDVTFGTPNSVAAVVDAPLEGADGRIVYLLPDAGEANDDLLGAASRAASRTELVFGIPREAQSLLAGVYDWCAWESVRRGVEALAHDPVARRELSARILFASDRLDAAVESCFGIVEGARVAWIHQGAERPWHGARALSSALSAVCDRSFPDAPRIRNELLNRRALSSAAAAARRALLDAMVAHPDRPRLAIEGAPPEYSMYASLLAAGGLHRERDGRWGFGPPPPEDPLRLAPTWQRIEAFLDTTEDGARPLRALFDELAARPLGLREGPVPVLLFALVLAAPGEVAFFEDGSFVPEVTDAVVERLLRRVDHFAVARFRVDEGRRAVLSALGAALGFETPSARPVEIARAVVRRVAQLPRYARGTRAIDADAAAARDVVLAARDPMRLLFVDLPGALGFKPVARGGADGGDTGGEYAARLVVALRALADAHPTLLASVERSVRESLGMPGAGEEFRAELAARARRAQGSAADLRLKAFLGRALEARAAHPEWIEGLAMVVAGRPPSEWTDGDLPRFASLLAELRTLLERAEDIATAQDALSPEQAGAIEGAEQEILRVLEGRFGAHREVWLAALRRTLHAVLAPPQGGASTDPPEGSVA